MSRCCKRRSAKSSPRCEDAIGQRVVFSRPNTGRTSGRTEWSVCHYAMSDSSELLPAHLSAAASVSVTTLLEFHPPPVIFRPVIFEASELARLCGGMVQGRTCVLPRDRLGKRCCPLATRRMNSTRRVVLGLGRRLLFFLLASTVLKAPISVGDDDGGRRGAERRREGGRGQMHSVPESSCHRKLWAVVSAQSTLFSSPSVPSWLQWVVPHNTSVLRGICAGMFPHGKFSAHDDFKGRLGNTKYKMLLEWAR